MVRQTEQEAEAGFSRTKVIGIVLIVVVASIGLTWAFMIGPWAPRSVITLPTETTGTTTFTVWCYVHSYSGTPVRLEDVDDFDNVVADGYVYRTLLTGLTAAQIEDLVITDYTLYDSGDAEDLSITITAIYAWLFVINASGFNQAVYRYDSGTITSTMELPLLPYPNSVNPVNLLNQTADIDMLAYETTGLGSTVLNTNERDWTVLTQCDSEDEGVSYQYDIFTGEWSGFCINCTFNTTAQSSWVTTPTGAHAPISKVATGSDILLFFDTMFDETTYKLRFSSGLGVTFEAASISVGAGTEGSVTQYDTQP
jgi:hypothetical protein